MKRNFSDSYLAGVLIRSFLAGVVLALIAIFFLYGCSAVSQASVCEYATRVCYYANQICQLESSNPKRVVLRDSLLIQVANLERAAGLNNSQSQSTQKEGVK